MRKQRVSPTHLGQQVLGSSLVAIALLASTHASAEKAPITERPYNLAQDAYKAYQNRDYAAAVASAKRAVLLQPKNRAYWMLLLNSLIADNKLDDALRTTDEIKKRFGQKSDLQTLHKSVSAQLAFSNSASAYLAAKQGKMELAVTLARNAAQYQPEAGAFTISLINMLVLNNQLSEAEQVASDMIKSGILKNEAQLLRASIRQLLGAAQPAEADFDQAVAQANPNQQRGIRLVASDAALENGDSKRAADLLASLADDKEVTERRRLIQVAPARAVIKFTYPQVQCVTGDSLLSVCKIQPSSSSADAGYAMADLGYAAMAKKDYALAASNASEAIKLAPKNVDYRRLYVQALLAQGANAEAEKAADSALADIGSSAGMLLIRADLRKQFNNTDGARADYAAVLTAPDVKPREEVVALHELGRDDEAHKRLVEIMNTPDHGSDLDLAYLAIKIGNDSDALAFFRRADEQGRLTDSARLDAAYTASRNSNNKEAVNYFHQTVDASEAGRIAMGPQQVFDLRRASGDLERNWGINAIISQGGVATAGFGIPYGSSTNGTYAGAEIYWRPFQYQNGKLLELYTRVSQTIAGGSNIVKGGETAQVALGARVKPFSKTNVFFAMERLIALGDATSNDWLARLCYSLDEGRDLHKEKTDWFSAHVYAEAGHYFQHPQNYAVFEGQLGHSYQLGSNWIVFPHVVLAGNYDSTIFNHKKQAWGSGLGTNLTYWFREDKYTAPLSHIDLSVQYRWRVAADDRAEGWFIRLSASY